MNSFFQFGLQFKMWRPWQSQPSPILAVQCRVGTLRFHGVYLTRISFFWHFRTERSRRRDRSDADGCSGCKGVGGIDDYLVRFRYAIQDFGPYAKVTPNLDVTKLHNAMAFTTPTCRFFREI